MADVTTRYGFPYQEATDPPDGAALGEDLAVAVEDSLGTVEDALDARLDTIEARYARGVVYYGNRTSTAGPTSGSTELGVLRLDGMTLTSGRIYKVDVSNVRPDTTVSGDGVKLTLRHNSAGTATTGSTEIGRSESNVAGVDQDMVPSPTGLIIPGSTVATNSVLLSIVRFSGTGTISLTGDTGGLWMTVTDLGPAPSDTGVDV